MTPPKTTLTNGNGTWKTLTIALLVALLGLLTYAPFHFVTKNDYNRDMDKRDEARTAIFRELKDINGKITEVLQRLPKGDRP